MNEHHGFAPAQRSAIPQRPDQRLIEGLTDLAHHARRAELPLADELLTDILAILHGWPVRGLSQFQ